MCKHSHYVAGVLVNGSYSELINRIVHMVMKVYGFSMVRYSSSGAGYIACLWQSKMVCRGGVT